MLDPIASQAPFPNQALASELPTACSPALGRLLGAVLSAALCVAPVAMAQDIGHWIPRANTPITRSEAVGARIGNNIYLVGGFGTNGGAVELQIYTPATNSWRTLKPLQHSSAAGVLLPFGDKLYLIGGVDTTGLVLNKVQEYDPVGETWRERAPMSLAREHIGAAVLDSLLYVVAGREKGLGGVSGRLFEAYDPVRNTWQKLPDLPTPRSGLCLAAANGRLYAIGGEWPGTFDLNEEYDPATRAWRTVEPMLARRHGFAAVNFNDTIYVMGMVAASEAFIPPPASTTRILSRNRYHFKNQGRRGGFEMLPSSAPRSEFRWPWNGLSLNGIGRLQR